MKKLLLQKYVGICKLSVQSLVLIFAALFSLPVMAQKNKLFDPAQLSISFQELNTNDRLQNQSQTELVLTNTGKSKFPAKGWKIYFNVKSDIKAVSEFYSVELTRQKANLFQLSPKVSFNGIAPGKNLTMQLLLDGDIINKNDQPEGFYLVWDNAFEKGYDIKNVTVIPAPLKSINGKLISDFAETVYYFNAAINKEVDADAPIVFPTPVNYGKSIGAFALSGSTSITTDAAFKNEASLLADDLSMLLDKKPGINYAAAGNAIQLKMKEGIPAEGYELIITTEGITIAATTSSGIFYGVQSLKTCLPTTVWNKKQQVINVPGTKISDAPRFGYRGFMLDVGRNFQTKKEVLRVLDLMALYKLNTFHFHITDDEGWRIEIDGLPELTDVGANRGHSLDEKNKMPAAYGSGANTGQLYGSGYYTKADFIEILQYANNRHIEVVTEIETPGHARAAIKAMDNRYRKFMQQGKRDEALQYLLRDTLDDSYYSTPQSFHDNVMNVALPSVYTFIDKVVSEIKKLYQQANVPLATIHLGGDEVPAGVWEKSPACNELIKNNPTIENTNGLWYYYLNKVNDILKSKGLSLSGWEEIGLRKTELDEKKIVIPNPEFVKNDLKLYVWNNIEGNEDLAYKLANSGYKVILTFVTNFYFDMAQSKTYNEPGYYWGGFTDIEKVYRFIAFDYLKNTTKDYRGNEIRVADLINKQRLTDYGKNNVAGLQAAVWGETIKGPGQLEYMLLPRLAALAERAWAKAPTWANETDTEKMNTGYNAAWSSFVQQVSKRQLPMLDYYNDGYNYRIPPAGAILQNGTVLANAQFPDLTIRYTMNNTEPTVSSPVYNMPITAKGIIKLKVFNSKGRESYTTVIENK